jgi:hypothetical protein
MCITRIEPPRDRELGQYPGLCIHIAQLVKPRGPSGQIGWLTRITEDAVQLLHDGTRRGLTEVRVHRYHGQVCDAICLDLPDNAANVGLPSMDRRQHTPTLWQQARQRFGLSGHGHGQTRLPVITGRAEAYQQCTFAAGNLGLDIVLARV